MAESSNNGREAQRRDERKVKCLVWDLDNTLWDGVLLEDERVTPREGVAEIVKALDARGIVQSIASKNDHAAAMAKLRDFRLDEYFIHPQINWQSKVASIKKIAGLINVGLDALAFADDQPFELDEVRFSLPEVLCVDAAGLGGLLDMPEMTPRFITEDSRLRRWMYLDDIARQRSEEEFAGTREEFLATLGMTFTLSAAGEEDLRRAEELTVRTNQLNTTGRTYSYEELDRFRQSRRHKLLIAGLEDKYGSYGKIGLALVELNEAAWVVKLLLVSCRVMSRGVGMVMLSHIMRAAKEKKVRLLSEFVASERNRMMYVSYKFMGFREVSRDGDASLLEHDLTEIPPVPSYLKVEHE
nr:FkbH like protein [uncultured bacterium]